MDILVPAIYYLKNPFNHSKLVLNLAQFGGNILEHKSWLEI